MSKNSLNGLADKLAEKSGLSQIEAELFIRKMFDVCHQGLAADKIVKMRWLGTFKVTSVKERESVDVNTGERIVIEGRDKISFTPDNILKEIVNKSNDPVEAYEAARKLQKIPRNANPIRLHNRCKITGRPKGYIRLFGLSRIQFREMASNGLIPGVKKSSC